MTSSERAPRLAPVPPYTYRRELNARELIVPVAVGAGVGVLAGYIAWLLVQRTPLVPTTTAVSSRARHPQRRPRA